MTEGILPGDLIGPAPGFASVDAWPASCWRLRRDGTATMFRKCHRMIPLASSVVALVVYVFRERASWTHCRYVLAVSGDYVFVDFLENWKVLSSARGRSLTI